MLIVTSVSQRVFGLRDMFHASACRAYRDVSRVHQNNSEQTSVRLSAAAIFGVETPESPLQANLVLSEDSRPEDLLPGSKQSQTRRWRCCVALRHHATGPDIARLGTRSPFHAKSLGIDLNNRVDRVPTSSKARRLRTQYGQLHSRLSHLQRRTQRPLKVVRVPYR